MRPVESYVYELRGFLKGLSLIPGEYTSRHSLVEIIERKGDVNHSVEHFFLNDFTWFKRPDSVNVSFNRVDDVEGLLDEFIKHYLFHDVAIDMGIDYHEAEFKRLLQEIGISQCEVFSSDFELSYFFGHVSGIDLLLVFETHIVLIQLGIDD